MFISSQRSNSSTPITVHNQQLKYAKVVKYLGLYIDESLTWQLHVEQIQKKIVAPIGILKRLSYCIPKHLLRTV
jgi:hypothetical protein